MKTILQPLKNCIKVDNESYALRKFSAILLCLCAIIITTANSNPSLKSTAELNILKRSNFGNAINRGTILKFIYRHKSDYLFYYISNGPGHDHINEGLVVFINNRYHHDYYINQTCNFKVFKQKLVCHFPDFPGEIETNLLSDVFAGKKLLIGGSEERPWRGSKTLYK